MNGNILTLHKMIDNDLLDDIDIELDSFNLSYTDNNDFDKLLTLNDIDESKVYLGEAREYWDANNDNLKVQRNINLTHPESLFGPRGVATENTKLGIAYQIHSKSSGFQETKDLGVELTSNTVGKISVNFNYEFPPASIKGEVNVNIFVFVRESDKEDARFASEKGVELGVIDHFQLVIDGEGSNFPIVEVNHPGNPLWQLIMKWTDITQDSFDIEYVRLEMNKAHEMYDYIFKDTKPSLFLLYEILSDVMTQIIYKAVNDDDYTDNPEDPESIANVVSYWVSTYEVDINSLESISYSLRNKLGNSIGK